MIRRQWDLVPVSTRVTERLMEEVRADSDGFGFVLILTTARRDEGVVVTSNLSPESRHAAAFEYLGGSVVFSRYLPADPVGQPPPGNGGFHKQ